MKRTMARTRSGSFRRARTVYHPIPPVVVSLSRLINASTALVLFALLEFSLLHSGGVTASVFDAHIYPRSYGTRVFMVDRVESTTWYFVVRDVAPDLLHGLSRLLMLYALQIERRNIVHVQRIARTCLPLAS